MTRQLYLIRHGLADRRSRAWPDDTKRPLTDRGISQLQKQARGLERLGVSFHVVLTSPLARARQTADLLAAGLVPRPPIVVTETLAPGGTWALLVGELAKHGRRSRIALVGHEPGLGELAARFLGAGRPIPLKKGAVCRIDMDAWPPDGPGQLRWLLTPKALRAIGR